MAGQKIITDHHLRPRLTESDRKYIDIRGVVGPDFGIHLLRREQRMVLERLMCGAVLGLWDE